MTAIDDLLAVCGEISDLGRARALLAWDERTQMPAGGAPARAEQLATLTRLRHRRLASGELGRLLEAARAETDGADPDSFEASLVRMTAREWEKARRVPAELRAEIARTASVSEHAWTEARKASDFPAFLPHLERIVDLKRRYADCFDHDHPYDPLLDDYEPGMTTAQLRPVLERLRDGLRPLVAAIGEREDAVDDSCLHGEFDVGAQHRLAERVIAGLPLTAGSWRLDETVHPFATGIAVEDLRITTRFDPAYVGAALWAVIHEAGHALYQNGIDPRLERTPLCRSASLGFDESQSRMWENWIGRGRPYLARIRPLLAESFGDRFATVDDEALYRAANRSRPSLIRMEADEVTYNLHIALRFDLELGLFEGRLEPADLPGEWSALTREYLGIEIPDNRRGVLQDVHWAGGAFGYFPTYSLGNVIAGQLWATLTADLGDPDELIAAGELGALREWLRDRVYRHGGKLMPAELVERACGGPLDTDPLLTQLRTKFGEIYGLD
ncbi:MAG TPA: carboxypeptidase M32 [Solirubrobacterales bacterium]|nr:carboxypeptidase M32 [Solirubrobacterales bacterium]